MACVPVSVPVLYLKSHICKSKCQERKGDLEFNARSQRSHSLLKKSRATSHRSFSHEVCCKENPLALLDFFTGRVPRSIYPTTFTCSSSANNSPRRYDLDDILDVSESTDPLSPSEQAFARFATASKKYSIAELAEDEALKKKRERLRSSRRKRFHNQHLKKHESDETSRIKVRSKPSIAVKWVFSFMDCADDKEKKESSSSDPINQALKEVSFAVTF